MKRKTLALLAALTMLLVAAPTTHAVTEMCVTVWEAGGGGGDHWTLCDFPNSLHNASLVGDTTGLQNGCQSRFPFVNSDWNDCISTVDYSNMPPGYHLELDWNINYGGTKSDCLDADGNYPGVHTMNLGNDQVSSWRIIGGNCP